MRRADYRPPPYLVPRAFLDLDLGLETTTVRSTLTLQRNPAGPAAGPLCLDCEGPEVLDIAIDGRPADPSRFDLTSTRLLLHDPPDACELRITTRLSPSANASLVGLYATDGQLCTHCEPGGFRRITPFPDRPDVLTRYTVRLEGDRESFPVMLANGNPAGSGDAGGGRHWRRWEDPFPKSCYLFAIVAGRFARRSVAVTTRSGRQVTLSVYAAEADLPHLEFALDALRAAVAWDESHYGLECDLDVFNMATVSDHNFGAMENKGLNIYTRASIITTAGRYTTDADYRLIAANVAHEYFHNWTGNRVTGRDWFQLALKEGWTTFRTEQYEEQRYGRVGSRIALVRNLHTKLFAEESAATAHAVVPDSCIEPSNLYNSTVYLKGAAIVRMLHQLVGPAAYRSACDRFLARFDGAAATVDDFVDAMAEASGRDLAQFRRWYYQPGTPVIRVAAEHDALAATYRLTLAQELPQVPAGAAAEPLHIPIGIGLLAANGRPLLPQGVATVDDRGTVLVELRQAALQVEFAGVPEPPVPSLLRDFGAPVKLEFPYTDQELLVLARHDSDEFNRWDAIQRLYSRVVLASECIDQASLEPLLGLLIEVLQGANEAPDLAAEMLTLPSEKELAESVDCVDVEGICGRRLELKRAMAAALAPALLPLYASLDVPGPYRPEPVDAARRRLRGTCLEYLVLGDPATGIDLAVAQQARATSMTDEISAAAALNQVTGQVRERVFAALLERWRPEPLAVDKWFQLQALHDAPGAVERVHALQAHPDFDMRRVSRVKSLFAWFFILNFRGFHEPSGAGYEYLVDVVQGIDRYNGTAAAWMLRKSDLMRWRRFAGPRREQMQRALERLLATDGLTNGTRERASGALAET